MPSALGGFGFSGSPGPFGDGSDGALTVNAGTTTLTKDTYATSVHIVSGGVLKPAGFKLLASQSIVVDSGGSINIDGNAGVIGSGSAAGGAALAAEVLGASGAGTNGVTGSPSSPAAVLNSLGGGGTAPGTTLGGARDMFAALSGHIIGAATLTQINGGKGGSGGAGNGAAKKGGGGGGGAGVMVIVAPTISNSGTISANGGAAGNGDATGNTNGGDGGGGGVVWCVANSYSGNAITATGGVKGLKGGTGADGANGPDGTVISIVG